MGLRLRALARSSPSSSSAELRLGDALSRVICMGTLQAFKPPSKDALTTIAGATKEPREIGLFERSTALIAVTAELCAAKLATVELDGK
eukprot:scaffold1159_cov215-Pinguiococcus_pyrenoidosus.AAC.16